MYFIVIKKQKETDKKFKRKGKEKREMYSKCLSVGSDTNELFWVPFQTLPYIPSFLQHAISAKRHLKEIKMVFISLNSS